MIHRFYAGFLAAALLGACAARQPLPDPVCCTYGTMVSDRLLFGRDIEGRDSVTEARWTHFVQTVVAPAFRNEGWTVYRTDGYWNDATSGLVIEKGFVLERIHRLDARTDSVMNAIARAYIVAFQQQAVLRVRSAATETLIQR
jgi:hypothetical protein